MSEELKRDMFGLIMCKYCGSTDGAADGVCNYCFMIHQDDETPQTTKEEGEADG